MKYCGIQRLFPDRDIVSIQNILHGVTKKYKKEFREGKNSFFQRVVQGDESIQRHFVGFITDIKETPTHFAVGVSDGSYILWSNIAKGDEDDQIVHSKTCESEIIRFLRTHRIYVG